LTFEKEHGKIDGKTLCSKKANFTITERVYRVNLTQKSAENVEYMIEKIKEKLKVLNIGAIKPSHFDEEMYEELREIYEMVMKKNSFSPSEMQALVEELGNLRKQ
jgi:uncharacterized protein YfkK (UPF0435 family)